MSGRKSNPAKDSLGPLARPVLLLAVLCLGLLLACTAMVFLLIVDPINRTQIDLAANQKTLGYAKAIDTYISGNQSNLDRLLSHASAIAAVRDSEQAQVFDPYYWREAFADADELQLIPLSSMGTAEPRFNKLEFSNTERSMIAQVAKGARVPPEVTVYKSKTRVTLVSPIVDERKTTIGVGVLSLRFSALSRLLVNIAGLGSGDDARVSLLQVNDAKSPLILADLGSGASNATHYTVDIPNSHNWQLRYTPSIKQAGEMAVSYTLPIVFIVVATILLIIAYIGAVRSLCSSLLEDKRQLEAFIAGRVIDRSFPKPRLNLPILQDLVPQLADLMHSLFSPTKASPNTNSTPEEIKLTALDLPKARQASPETRGQQLKKSGKQSKPAAQLPSATIFRAYDIRGIVGTELTEEIVYEIGRALGSMALESGETNALVARDGRISSPQFAERLIQGLLETGIHVTDLGATPTPVLYFAAHHLDTGTAVMVTGSHSPAAYNGIKMMFNKQSLASEHIQRLRQRMSTGKFESGTGTHVKTDMRAAYLDAVFANITAGRSLKVVLDCGNGIAGVIAPQMVEELGCDVIPLYCDVDGNFPNHHPDPSVPANMAALAAQVKASGADLGIAFDGDGDRMGAVTSDGNIIPADYLLLLFARQILPDNIGSPIVFDVKCSAQLALDIVAHGGKAVMWKSGHSLIKQKLAELKAPLGGEFSGHFCFADRWYGFDDGLYAAARLIEILSTRKQGLAELLSDLPAMVATPEIVIEVGEERKFVIVDTVSKNASFEPAAINRLDGIRVDYSYGWGLLRASNTGPNLILRFEATNKAGMERIQHQFRKAILASFPDLHNALSSLDKGTH